MFQYVLVLLSVPLVIIMFFSMLKETEGFNRWLADRKHKSKESKTPLEESNEEVEVKSKIIQEGSLQDQLILLEGAVKDHKKYRLSYAKVELDDTVGIAGILQLVIDETQALSAEIKKTEDSTILEIFEVEYSDILYRLNKLVGPEYWGDMLERPKYYKNPGVVERRKKVIEATSSVLDGLVEKTRALVEQGDFDREVNIRVINQRTDKNNTI